MSVQSEPQALVSKSPHFCLHQKCCDAATMSHFCLCYIEKTVVILMTARGKTTINFIFLVRTASGDSGENTFYNFTMWHSLPFANLFSNNLHTFLFISYTWYCFIQYKALNLIPRLKVATITGESAF